MAWVHVPCDGSKMLPEQWHYRIEGHGSVMAVIRMPNDCWSVLLRDASTDNTRWLAGGPHYDANLAKRRAELMLPELGWQQP